MRTTQHYTNPIGTKSTQLKETPFPPKRHAVHRAAGRKLAPVLLAKGDRQDGVVYWDTPLPPSRPAPPIACVLTHTWHLAFSQLHMARFGVHPASVPGHHPPVPVGSISSGNGERNRKAAAEAGLAVSRSPDKAPVRSRVKA